MTASDETSSRACSAVNRSSVPNEDDEARELVKVNIDEIQSCESRTGKGKAKGSEIDWLVDVVNEIIEWNPIGFDERDDALNLSRIADNSGSRSHAATDNHSSSVFGGTAPLGSRGEPATLNVERIPFGGASGVIGSLMQNGSSMPFLPAVGLPVTVNGGTLPFIGVGAPTLPFIGTPDSHVATAPTGTGGPLSHSGVLGMSTSMMAPPMQDMIGNYPTGGIPIDGKGIGKDMQGGFTGMGPVGFGMLLPAPVGKGCWP